MTRVATPPPEGAIKPPPPPAPPMGVLSTLFRPVMDQEKKEAVNHPDHYGGGENPYEVRKVLFAWGLHTRANLWNVVKYVARAGRKDPAKELEDLRKARFYLDEEIHLLETGTLRGMP